MTVIRQSMIVAAALLLAAPPAQAQEAPPSAQVLAGLSDAEIAKRVDAAIAQVVARPEAAGLSVAVARGDKIIVERGAGFANAETKRPADASTEFRIGSVTKQFTAAAIMKLVERGKIALDDPLSKYLPDFDTGRRTVTIRQLLNHASGIPNYTAQPGFAAIAAKPGVTKADVLKVVAGVPFDFEPGKGWRYSNTNYFLLGMVVETVSGQSYADFVEQEFFKPVGLKHTRYDTGDGAVADRALGYSFDPAARALRAAQPINMALPFAAGALASTAGDLLRWQIALTNGRAVSPATFQQMSGSTVNIGQGDAAYGFGLMVDRVGGTRRVWHNGGINGFNSILTWWQDLGLRTAVISNSEDLPSDAVQQLIVASLTSAKPVPPPRTTADPGGAAAVRKFIEDQVNDRTDYSTMTPPMADLVRAHPEGKAMFTAWGPIKAIDFLSTDLGGMDSYRVQFTAGPPVLFDLIRTADGKIAMMRFRPAGPPPTP